MAGWTGNEVVYADKLVKLWDEVEEPPKREDNSSALAARDARIAELEARLEAAQF